MKNIFLFITALTLVGCASSTKKEEAKTKPILERPWIGGRYETANTPKLVRTNASYKFGKHGALLSTVHTNSPLEKAGLRETDLILAVNGEKVRSEREIHKRAARTGSNPATFTIYRDGEVLEKTVTPGRERYQKWRMIGFAVALPTRMDFDLWPDPSFSLVLLGYKEDYKRLDLQDAHSMFNASERVRSGKAANDDGWIGQSSEEGWRCWLGPFVTEKRYVIVSQE